MTRRPQLVKTGTTKPLRHLTVRADAKARSIACVTTTAEEGLAETGLPVRSRPLDSGLVHGNSNFQRC
jgi:hypothetical protein